MACPLFIPSSWLPASALGEFAGIAAPLGDLHHGCCAGAPSVVIEPETLRRCCNFGYARGQCERAGGSNADAVRFLIKSAQGNIVQVAWAVERNHHPVATGTTGVDITLAVSPAADALTHQVHACAAAFARQTWTDQSFGNTDSVGQIAVAAHP